MKNTPTEDQSAVPSSTNLSKPGYSSLKTGDGDAMRCGSVMNCTSVPLSKCNFLTKILTQTALASCRTVTTTHRCLAQVMLGRLLVLCYLVLLAPSIFAQNKAEISRNSTTGYQFQCASVLDLHPVFGVVVDDLKEPNPAIDTQIVRHLTISLQRYLNTKTGGAEIFRSDDSHLILEPVGCNEQGSNNPFEWKCEKFVDQSHIDGPISYACGSIYGENTSFSCSVNPVSSCQEMRRGVNVFYSGGISTNEPSLSLSQYTRGAEYIYISVNYSGASEFSESKSGQFPAINKNQNVIPEWKCTRLNDQDGTEPRISYSCRSLYGEVVLLESNPFVKSEKVKFKIEIKKTLIPPKLSFTLEYDNVKTSETENSEERNKEREDRDEAENRESKTVKQITQ